MLRKFLPLLALTFFVACDKPDNTPKAENCDEAILEQLGYLPSDGNIEFSNTNCLDYLNKFESLRGGFLYSPECTCCDMIPQLYDCSGENICDGEGRCPALVRGDLVGIVGVKE